LKKILCYETITKFQEQQQKITMFAGVNPAQTMFVDFIDIFHGSSVEQHPFFSGKTALIFFCHSISFDAVKMVRLKILYPFGFYHFTGRRFQKLSFHCLELLLVSFEVHPGHFCEVR